MTSSHKMLVKCLDAFSSNVINPLYSSYSNLVIPNQEPFFFVEKLVSLMGKVL